MLTGRSMRQHLRDVLADSRIRPSSGVSKPASIRSSVVLPQPLGPSSAKNSPARISSDSRSTARKLPNFFDHALDAQQRHVDRQRPAAATGLRRLRGAWLHLRNPSAMFPTCPTVAHASGGSGAGSTGSRRTPNNFAMAPLLRLSQVAAAHRPMKITIVAFEGCMTSAVYGQADAFAIAAYISGRRPMQAGRTMTCGSPHPKAAVQGYGGHTIAPHCALAEASDSDVILIPPIFSDIEADAGAGGRPRLAGSDHFRTQSTLLASTLHRCLPARRSRYSRGPPRHHKPGLQRPVRTALSGLALALDERLIDDGR